MALEQDQRDWNDLANLDPHWAILGTSNKRFGRWSDKDFFQTGESEIAALLTNLHALGKPLEFTRALDFGCGIGRLTVALGRHFPECYGIDISENMVQQARTLHAESTSCQFLLNTSPDLRK